MFSFTKWDCATIFRKTFATDKVFCSWTQDGQRKSQRKQNGQQDLENHFYLTEISACVCVCVDGVSVLHRLMQQIPSFFENTEKLVFFKMPKAAGGPFLSLNGIWRMHTVHCTHLQCRGVHHKKGVHSYYGHEEENEVWQKVCLLSIQKNFFSCRTISFTSEHSQVFFFLFFTVTTFVINFSNPKPFDFIENKTMKWNEINWFQLYQNLSVFSFIQLSSPSLPILIERRRKGGGEQRNISRRAAVGTSRQFGAAF